jgi:hypothetical protein
MRVIFPLKGKWVLLCVAVVAARVPGKKGPEGEGERNKRAAAGSCWAAALLPLTLRSAGVYEATELVTLGTCIIICVKSGQAG